MKSMHNSDLAITSGLPDVAHLGVPASRHHINRVGMEFIEVPLRLNISENKTFLIPAHANAYISLASSQTKGIHMSRLFLILQSKLEENVLTQKLLHDIVKDFCLSHKNETDSAYLKLSFDLPLKRRALISSNSGWRFYPVTFYASLERKNFQLSIQLNITYSSTCPCSAALARQLIQQKFAQDFNKEDTLISKQDVMEWLGLETSILATPHGQRSVAKVMFALDKPSQEYNLINMIDDLENSLKTPVQSAVKREDEQEFARLNGQNLMFAEDAVRKIAHVMDLNQRISGYKITATHFESLHPHNAEASLDKNIESLCIF